MALGGRPSERARIVIDVDCDPTMLRGSLTFPDRTVQAFTGWLELASAVETVHRDLARSNGARTGDPPFGDHPDPW